MSQRQTVLQALRGAGPRGVTNGELNALGIFRYSARVHELREQGHTIRTINGKNGLARFVLEAEVVPGLEAAHARKSPPADVGSLEFGQLFRTPPAPHWQDG